MEVEIKYLLSESDFSKAVALFAPFRSSEELMITHFFDGPTNQLLAKDAFFRLRISNGVAHATLKTRGTVESRGESLRFASDVTIPLAHAMNAIQLPDTILSWPEPIFQSIRSQYGCASLRSVGSFTTHRTQYKVDLNMLLGKCESARVPAIIKIDRSSFAFGPHRRFI